MSDKPTLTNCFAAVVASVLEMNRLSSEYNKKVNEFVALVDAFPAKKEQTPCVK